MGFFRGQPGLPDVLVIRQSGAVEHDRGVSPFQRVFDLFDRFAVVEVQRDGLGAAFRHADEASGEVVCLVGVEQPHVELDDDRRLLPLGGEDDGAGGFVIGGVERADGAFLFSCRGQQLPQGDQ
ncbi:hypothetical protein SDC9_195952 [bioreactor metagenome]|uniref:Uncharacterized protein n=1 Tax=bioreactor metagenome TaxID=1076179 RepID=A0A645IAQ9_9ZZZZ